MNRKEAIALLLELGTIQLLSPDFVILEERNLDNYRLKVKGCYNSLGIGVLLKDRFLIEENENYLTISSL